MITLMWCADCAVMKPGGTEEVCSNCSSNLIVVGWYESKEKEEETEVDVVQTAVMD